MCKLFISNYVLLVICAGSNKTKQQSISTDVNKMHQHNYSYSQQQSNNDAIHLRIESTSQQFYQSSAPVNLKQYASYKSVKRGPLNRLWSDARISDYVCCHNISVIISFSFLQTSTSSAQQANVNFTVLSYNTLCQSTINRTKYLYPPHAGYQLEHLEWPHRWSLLSAELKKYNADIVCLQEVQMEHYNTCYRDLLRRLGLLLFIIIIFKFIDIYTMFRL
jgi:hypothetical protein